MYVLEEIAMLKKQYNPLDVRTWPYFPIVMPLKETKGPADVKECDEITWEVWDRFCDSVASYVYLPDAINHALRLNKKLMGD